MRAARWTRKICLTTSTASSSARSGWRPGHWRTWVGHRRHLPHAGRVPGHEGGVAGGPAQPHSAHLLPGGQPGGAPEALRRVPLWLPPRRHRGVPGGLGGAALHGDVAVREVRAQAGARRIPFHRYHAAVRPHRVDGLADAGGPAVVGDSVRVAGMGEAATGGVAPRQGASRRRADEQGGLAHRGRRHVGRAGHRHGLVVGGRGGGGGHRAGHRLGRTAAPAHRAG